MFFERKSEDVKNIINIIEAQEQKKEEFQLEAYLEERAKKDRETEKKESLTEAREEARVRNVQSLAKFKTSVKNSLLEARLNYLFEGCFEPNYLIVMSEDTKAFNKSLVSKFIKEETADKILADCAGKTLFLSEMVNDINSRYNTILENVDKDDPETFTVSNSDIGEIESDEEFFDTLDGSEDLEEVKDLIKMRVSAATQEFIENNREKKEQIQDIIDITKQRIDAVRTGNDQEDEAIKMEHTLRMKRQISDLNKFKSRTVYEQLVANLTESVIKSESLKEKFTVNGKLDMDAIVERANSMYTFLEMLNTLKIKSDEQFVSESVLF